MRNLVIVTSLAIAASPVEHAHPDEWIAASGLGAAAFLVAAGCASLGRFRTRPSRHLRWLTIAAIWCVGFHLSVVVAHFVGRTSALAPIAPNIVLGAFALLPLLALALPSRLQKRRSRLADAALVLAALHIAASNDPSPVSYAVLIALLAICALRTWRGTRAPTVAQDDLSTKVVHP